VLDAIRRRFAMPDIRFGTGVATLRTENVFLMRVHPLADHITYDEHVGEYHD